MPSSAPEAVTEVDVGERLRDIRRSRRATLRTIADRAGVSESFLSQVERGRASASIASLRRIAGALGVSVSDLFEPGGPPRPRVLRREQRPSLAFGVLADAFIVRMTLVPAVMALLGRWAWWMPPRLSRLVPNLDIEG